MHSELRVLLKHVRSAMQQRFGRQSSKLPWQGVLTFYFLRFIVPAIIHPNIWGLFPGPPSESVHRSLNLVAKTIQNLANVMIVRVPTNMSSWQMLN